MVSDVRTSPRQSRGGWTTLNFNTTFMKSALKCKTPAKAQINFRKSQRTRMNRAERRKPIEQEVVPQGRWLQMDRIWIWSPWANLGLIEWTEKGYRVVNYHPTGSFVMGMEKYSRRTVWRKSLESAKSTFLSRCPTMR